MYCQVEGTQANNRIRGYAVQWLVALELPMLRVCHLCNHCVCLHGVSQSSRTCVSFWGTVKVQRRRRVSSCTAVYLAHWHPARSVGEVGGT